MDEPFAVVVDGTGPRFVVKVSGELDIATCPDFVDRVMSAMQSVEVPEVVVDMSRLDFCDSSGLNAMLRLWKYARRAGGRLALVGTSHYLADKLNYTGLGRLLVDDA